MSDFVVWNILEVKNVGNCKKEVSILQYIVYRRERQRERVGGVPAFFVALQFLTLTLPRYKTETKMLKER